jgi:circadian clock protein KaiB
MKAHSSSESTKQPKLVLHLFVSGMSPKSMEAIENIKRLCREHVQDAFELEITDIYKNPEMASDQHIVFSPSLIKKLPLPRKILVGTLENSAKVIKALGI